MADDNVEIDLEDSDEEQTTAKPVKKSAAQIAREERLNKLQDLKLKKNEAVNLNRRDVVEEDKRNKLPSNWESRKRRVEEELSEEKAKQEAEARGEDYQRVKYMKMTAMDTDREHEKKRKNDEKADPGFADYRQASIRQYQRISSQIKPDLNEYAREMVIKGDEVFYNGANTLTYGDSERTKGDNVDRLIEDMDKQMKKRGNYSRRRTVDADADIDYINHQNMKFNRKIQRFYGESTSEIKQSLERGTAL